MTMPAPAGIEVSPPPVEPYRYGLLAAASIVPEAGQRWEAQGVVYRADGCGATGGIWLFPCDTPAPTVDVQAFQVDFEKPAAADDLVALLTARDPLYDPIPVTVTVDGVAQQIPAPGQTATWPVTPGAEITLTASIPATGVAPECSQTTTFTVPATADEGQSQLICTVQMEGPRPDQVKTISAGADLVNGRPFIVYETASCYALGLEAPEARTMAERRLALHEQWWVEYRTWFSILSEGFEVINPGGYDTPEPMPLLEALGMAEDLIADRYGGLGTIHVPRQYYSYLKRDDLLVKDGPRLRTPLDNYVSVGAGYSPEDPRNGQAVPRGQGWIYITGPVIARRSEVQTREDFDTRRNERLVISERSYAITTDCLRLAALTQFAPGGG